MLDTFKNPDDHALLSWMVRTECHILLELGLAGLTVADSDIPDDNESVDIKFDSHKGAVMFMAMIDIDTLPHREEWAVVTKRGRYLPLTLRRVRKYGEICVPRSDLGVAHERLKRYCAANVPDYAEQKRRAIERTGWTEA
jgi:hypothetical protein